MKRSLVKKYATGLLAAVFLAGTAALFTRTAESHAQVSQQARRQAGHRPETIVGGGIVFSPQTAHGMMEFYESGEFVPPLGVNNIYVQLWGAGGGGGGNPFVDANCAQGWYYPGSGGGGAYTASALTVTEEDSSFDIVVGIGGGPSQNGGDSSISLTSQHGTAGTILYAGGGYGGSVSADGAGGLADSRGMISHPGFPGAGGGCGAGSEAGQAWNYNLLPNEGWLGASQFLGGGQEGERSGGNGYVLIVW
jgi:hypothetical protein